MVFIASCSGSNKNDMSGKTDETVKDSITVNKSDIAAGKLTVLDFSAGWCMPCQQFKPEFSKVAYNMSSKAEFRTIDIDENPDMAAQFGIQSVPTVVILDSSGKELWRMTGYMSAEELTGFIQDHLPSE